MVYSKGLTPTIISSFVVSTPLLKIIQPYRGLFVGSLLCSIGFYLHHYASLLSQLVYVVCPQYVVPIMFFCWCPCFKQSLFVSVYPHIYVSSCSSCLPLTSKIFVWFIFLAPEKHFLLLPLALICWRKIYSFYLLENLPFQHCEFYIIFFQHSEHFINWSSDFSYFCWEIRCQIILGSGYNISFFYTVYFMFGQS